MNSTIIIIIIMVRVFWARRLVTGLYKSRAVAVAEPSAHPLSHISQWRLHPKPPGSRSLTSHARGRLIRWSPALAADSSKVFGVRLVLWHEMAHLKMEAGRVEADTKNCTVWLWRSKFLALKLIPDLPYSTFDDSDKIIYTYGLHRNGGDFLD